MKLCRMCVIFLLPVVFACFPPNAKAVLPQVRDDSLVWRTSAPEYGKVYTSEDCGNASFILLSPAGQGTEL